MFTPALRFLLLIISAVLAVVFAYMGSVPLILLCSIFSVTLLWGYYNRGTVMLAMNYLRKEDFEMAEKVIAKTTQPDKLGKSQRGYYYFVCAFIEREKDNLTAAEPLFLRAIAEGLKNEHFRAMALLSLADIEMVKGRKAVARDYVLQMKNLKVKPSLLPAVRRMQEWVGL
jgi:hypothetical protein